jgi:hypothetical protein
MGQSPRISEFCREVRSCRGIAAMAPGSAAFFFRLFCRPENVFLTHKSEMSFLDLEPLYEASKCNPLNQGEFFRSSMLKAGKEIASHLPGRESRVGSTDRDRTVNLDFGQNYATILHKTQNLALFGGLSNP